MEKSTRFSIRKSHRTKERTFSLAKVGVRRPLTFADGLFWFSANARLHILYVQNAYAGRGWGKMRLDKVFGSGLEFVLENR